jgi:hypothetical protein
MAKYGHGFSTQPVREGARQVRRDKGDTWELVNWRNIALTLSDQKSKRAMA